MPSPMFAYALLIPLAILLGIALVSDIRHRLIYDWTNIAIAALAPLWWWANGEALWPDVPIHLAVAAVTFLLFALAFAVGMMGGGDVKLFAALALWFDLVEVVELIFLASILGAVVTIAALAEHRYRGRPGKTEVPYGVAIAAAGLIHIAQRYLNHFS